MVIVGFDALLQPSAHARIEQPNKVRFMKASLVHAARERAGAPLNND
jgi:hypothetical protein